MLFISVMASCTKEPIPEPITNEEIEDTIQPYTINIFNNGEYHFIDTTFSANLVDVNNYVEYITFYNTKIIVFTHNIVTTTLIELMDYPYMSGLPIMFGFHQPYTIEGWFKIIIEKEYIEDELNILNIIKDNDGEWNVIENAIRYNNTPNASSCWLSDSQIELIISTINENI